jgi:tetratricopeptide (TPR) repeat protein
VTGNRGRILLESGPCERVIFVFPGSMRGVVHGVSEFVRGNRALALFGKKPGDDDKGGDNGGKGGKGDQPVFSPEKAVRFFEHAKTVQEATNYQYAAKLWLDGLRWDPSSMTGLEGFFGAIALFLGDPEASKKGIDKEVYKSVSGKTDVDKFLYGILDWGLKPTDSVLAVRAFEASAKLGNPEPAFWIGQRAFATCINDKKVKKDQFLKVSQCFQKIGAYNQAVAAAESASKMDPTDGELKAFIRNLAAQATMSKGGYERSGEAGGFRQNVRDSDKQRILDDEERISKTEQTLDRLIIADEEELAKRPGDLPTIEKFAKHLLERGKARDEERAHKLYMDAYTQTSQFRFRELAGDIRMRQARRKGTELRKMLESKPDDEMLLRMLEAANEDLLNLEIAEFKLRVEHYPTDLVRRFEYGKRLFAAGQYNDAIETFQEAQNDPKNRGAALNLLAQSFLKIGWTDEAIDALRRAMDQRDLMPETQLEMRYWLMVALQAKSTEARELAAAEEADRIASSIAVQQISYRDIRARREAIKKLVTELRGAKA